MSLRLHRLLRRLLPRPFRRKHGEAMEEVFREALAQARRRGTGAMLALWLREAIDVVRTAWALRRAAEGRIGSRIATRAGGGARIARGARALRDDARWAWTSLRRRPSFTVVAALTVAVGVGATTAVYSTVQSVLLRPLPFEGGDRVAQLWQRIGSSGGYLQPTAERQEAWAAQRDLFELTIPYRQESMTLTGRGAALPVQTAAVTPAFHDFVHVEPRLGRAFTPAELEGDGARVALLGHALWQSRFGGDPGVLGRSVDLDGEARTIVGVMPPRTPIPTGFTTTVDVFLPLPDAAPRGTGILARLRPGVTAEEVDARLDAVEDRLVAEGVVDRRYGGRAILVSEMIGLSIRDELRILTVGVVLLLLVACVDVSNLLLSRASRRRQETAVRTALGASRGRLIRQLLVESLLLGLLGAVGGLILAWGAVELVPLFRPDDLEVLERARIDGRVLGFSALLALAAGLLFGLAPAWGSSHSDPRESLGSGSRTVSGGLLGRRLRWGLVVAEVALSFALLAGSFLLFESLSGLQRTDPGFRAEEILVATVDLPDWKYPERDGREAVLQLLERRLGSIPGVEAISAGGVPPNVGITFGTVQIEGRAPGEETMVFHGPYVDERYFEVLGLPLVAGRGFTEADLQSDEPAYVLGESTARLLFGEEDPVGAQMRIGDPGSTWGTVVGVARDVLMGGAGSSDRLQLYGRLPEGRGARTFALRVAGNPARLRPAVEAAVREVEPDALLTELSTADAMLRDELARERFATTLLGAFAWMALVLAGVGLYGVVSQVVGQRRKEIGIRVSLGARTADIRGMVLRQGAVATGVGIAAGAGLAWVGIRLLENRLFGVEQGVEHAVVSPLLWASLALGGCALLATWIPARRAARVDPAEVLRIE